MPATELDWSEKLREVVIAIFIVCCVGLVLGVICDAIYLGLDHVGWVPHIRVVTVSLKSSSWIVGEYKACHSIDQQNLTRLSCDDTTETHDLKVTFWGTDDTNAQHESTWNCQRTVEPLSRKESLNCKRL
jgi:hypothetical protein